MSKMTMKTPQCASSIDHAPEAREGGTMCVSGREPGAGFRLTRGSGRPEEISLITKMGCDGLASPIRSVPPTPSTEARTGSRQISRETAERDDAKGFVSTLPTKLTHSLSHLAPERRTSLDVGVLVRRSISVHQQQTYQCLLSPM